MATVAMVLASAAAAVAAAVALALMFAASLCFGVSRLALWIEEEWQAYLHDVSRCMRGWLSWVGAFDFQERISTLDGHGNAFMPFISTYAISQRPAPRQERPLRIQFPSYPSPAQPANLAATHTKYAMWARSSPCGRHHGVCGSHPLADNPGPDDRDHGRTRAAAAVTRSTTWGSPRSAELEAGSWRVPDAARTLAAGTGQLSGYKLSLSVADFGDL